MIEMQTMGRVSPLPAPARKPTRTDAAMVAALIDSALAGLEAELSEEADLVWAGGFRYASFLEDARPLGLLLEDQAYRVLRCEVSLAQGAKGGEVLLALPAEGRGRRPDAGKPTIDTDAGPAFAAALADQVLGADAEVRAMVGRVTLPLSRVMALAPGDLLALGQAALDRVTLEGIDGCGLASGRLGQTRGMRAVRIVLAPGTDAHQPGTHQPGTPSLSGLTAAPTGPVLAATGTG
jgi:flagellar motor switch protein FliM